MFHVKQKGRDSGGFQNRGRFSCSAWSVQLIVLVIALERLDVREDFLPHVVGA